MRTNYTTPTELTTNVERFAKIASTYFYSPQQASNSAMHEAGQDIFAAATTNLSSLLNDDEDRATQAELLLIEAMHHLVKASSNSGLLNAFSGPLEQDALMRWFDTSHQSNLMRHWMAVARRSPHDHIESKTNFLVNISDGFDACAALLIVAYASSDDAMPDERTHLLVRAQVALCCAEITRASVEDSKLVSADLEWIRGMDNSSRGNTKKTQKTDELKNTWCPLIHQRVTTSDLKPSQVIRAMLDDIYDDACMWQDYKRQNFNKTVERWYREWLAEQE